MAEFDNASALRRKDTTKGPPLRILSLDGGGVRGFSIFIILEELMHRTFVEINGRAPRPEEITKPCDHFDLIGGTGTGGLIAIMLGRLRMDLKTCKDVYLRMTKRVFQTDKMIAGIPYKSTLYKASKLEEAIKQCVREHTVFEDEGNDILSNAVPMTPDSIADSIRPDGAPQRTMSQSSRYSQIARSPTTSISGMNFTGTRWGNSNALLYDVRENRTKTAVTAVYQGAHGAESIATLRSYDSRKEPAPDCQCTIWQAGRATSAIGVAFKPIQIGQYVYHDDGMGQFNPAPTLLDEAVQNEWPGRDVGVFVSVGTGKRPSTSTLNNQAEWWEGFMGGTVGGFVEAKRRLIDKIEGCEETHQFMLRRHLSDRGVNVDNYFRFNVEVGVGEFGMNEYERTPDISQNTKLYMARKNVQAFTIGAAKKLATVHKSEVRQRRAETSTTLDGDQRPSEDRWNLPPSRPPPPADPMAVELPADEPRVYVPYRPRYEHRPSIADEKYTVVAEDVVPGAQSYTGIGYTAPPSRQSQDVPLSNAPPLPPKTPLPYPTAQHPAERFGNRSRISSAGSNTGDRTLPYPDIDGPPPVVNTANKPTIRR